LSGSKERERRRRIERDREKQSLWKEGKRGGYWGDIELKNHLHLGGEKNVSVKKKNARTNKNISQ
jgi:hypothetical protein